MAKLVRIYAEKTLKKVPSSARTSRPSLTSASTVCLIPLYTAPRTRNPSRPRHVRPRRRRGRSTAKRSLAAAMAAEFDRKALHLRVLAVGDSLTAGYYNGGAAFHPYCKRLETLLQTALDDREGKRTRCEEVGRSGWTSEAIALKGPARGGPTRTWLCLRAPTICAGVCHQRRYLRTWNICGRWLASMVP